MRRTGRNLPYRLKRLLADQQRAVEAAKLPPADEEAFAQQQQSVAKMRKHDKMPPERRLEDCEVESPTVLHTHDVVGIAPGLKVDRAQELILKYGGQIFEKARAHVVREGDMDGIEAACIRLTGGKR